MKRLPVSVGMMVFGLMFVNVGEANSWAAIATAAGILVIIGFVWFCLLLDELYVKLKIAKRYDKRARRNEARQKEQEAYRSLMDKTNNHRLDMLEKRNSQNIKGQVVYINRKEA